MKNIKTFLVILLIAIGFQACSNDTENEYVNSYSNLNKIQEFTNATHRIELYGDHETLMQGYNNIYLRIKDLNNQEYVENANIQWMPMMHMAMHSHSCPFSEVSKAPDSENLFKGYIVFQMAQNDTEYWDLKIDYQINGVDYSMTEVIEVPASAKRNVTSFMGSDGQRYILALIQPGTPRVALNDMSVGVYKMESMHSFMVQDGYTVKIDPRMPGMGNHGSPNNVHLTQKSAGEMYHGKLSLTMTGYWKINLQLADASGDILKGEQVTESNEASSIFFEVEF